MRDRVLAAVVAIMLAGAATAWSGAACAAAPPIIYESQGYAGVGAYDPTGASVGYHLGDVNNIWLDGGYVYFQQSSIYAGESGVFRANADLSGATKIAARAGGSVDFAVDGAHGIIYESTGYAGLGAYDFTGASVGYHLGEVNNIWLDGGYVYFQQSSIYPSESGIYRANADLSDVTKIASLAGGSVDFAVDGAHGVIYESAGYAGLGAYDLTGANLAYYAGHVNNIWLDGGYVYFQQTGIFAGESGIFRANPDLSDVTKIASLAGNSVDFAVSGARAGGGDAVPEPAAWTLMIAGFGLAGAGLRRARMRPACG